MRAAEEQKAREEEQRKAAHKANGSKGEAEDEGEGGSGRRWDGRWDAATYIGGRGWKWVAVEGRVHWERQDHSGESKDDAALAMGDGADAGAGVGADSGADGGADGDTGPDAGAGARGDGKGDDKVKGKGKGKDKVKDKGKGKGKDKDKGKDEGKGKGKVKDKYKDKGKGKDKGKDEDKGKGKGEDQGARIVKGASADGGADASSTNRSGDGRDVQGGDGKPTKATKPTEVDSRLTTEDGIEADTEADTDSNSSSDSNMHDLEVRELNRRERVELEKAIKIFERGLEAIVAAKDQ